MGTGVVFDLDGTLVDTPAGIAEALTRTVLDLGGPEPEPAAVRATIGRPLDVVFPLLLRPAEPDSVTGEEVAAAITRYRELFTETVLPHARELVFPGVLSGLDALSAAGVPVAIATSKHHVTAVALLRESGLADHFDVVVTHDMVSNGKPHPEIALTAANLLGVHPAGCHLVGDSVDDMRVATGAGMRPVGVSYGVGSRDDLLEAGAATVVDSFGAVLREVIGR